MSVYAINTAQLANFNARSPDSGDLRQLRSTSLDQALTAIFGDVEESEIIGAFVHFEFLEENINDTIRRVFGVHSNRRFRVRSDGNLTRLWRKWENLEHIKVKAISNKWRKLTKLHGAF